MGTGFLSTCTKIASGTCHKHQWICWVILVIYIPLNAITLIMTYPILHCNAVVHIVWMIHFFISWIWCCRVTINCIFLHLHERKLPSRALMPLTGHITLCPLTLSMVHLSLSCSCMTWTAIEESLQLTWAFSLMRTQTCTTCWCLILQFHQPLRSLVHLSCRFCVLILIKKWNI